MNKKFFVIASFIFIEIFLTPISKADSPNNSIENTNNEWIAPKDAIPDSVVYNILKTYNPRSKIAFEKLIEIREKDTTRIEPDFTIALLYLFNNRDYTSARKHFLRCNKCMPEDIGTLVNLGTLCIIQKKYAEAYSYYKKAADFETHCPILAQNIGKVLYLKHKNILKFSPNVRKKYFDLLQNVLKNTKSTFSPTKGWLFSPCSEGYEKENFKKLLFTIQGYYPYEYPICLYCNGSGKIHCTYNSCSGGKVGYMVNVTHTFPNGDTATMPTRKTRRCNVCLGTGKLYCPLCKGTGCEIPKRAKPANNTKKQRHSDSENTPYEH